MWQTCSSFLSVQPYQKLKMARKFLNVWERLMNVKKCLILKIFVLKFWKYFVKIFVRKNKQPEKENASAVEQGCQTSAPLYCTTSYTWFPYLGTSLIAQSRKLHSSILQIINSSCLAFNKNVPNPIAGPKINKSPSYLIPGLFGLGLLLNKSRFFQVLEYRAKNKRSKETLLTCLADLVFLSFLFIKPQ